MKTEAIERSCGTSATDNDIALDTSGQPHVTYKSTYDNDVYYKNLDYGQRTGGTWQLQPVDTEANSGYYSSSTWITSACILLTEEKNRRSTTTTLRNNTMIANHTRTQFKRRIASMVIVVALAAAATLALAQNKGGGFSNAPAGVFVPMGVL